VLGAGLGLWVAALQAQGSELPTGTNLTAMGILALVLVREVFSFAKTILSQSREQEAARQLSRTISDAVRIAVETTARDFWRDLGQPALKDVQDRQHRVLAAQSESREALIRIRFSLDTAGKAMSDLTDKIQVWLDESRRHRS
jgi:hypothetical protein